MRNPLTILADPACQRIWLSGLGINVMRWLEFLAFSLFALAETGSPLLVALTGFARLVPLLFGAFLSAWIEGMDRRSVMFWVLAGLTVLDALMLILVLAGGMAIGWLLAAAFLAGIAWSFENSLRRTMLSEAAGRERMGESMGLEAASNQITRILGPALGGVLAASIGLIGVFALGVLLHGLAAYAMTGLPTALAGERRERVAVLVMLRDGIAFVRSNRLIQGSLAVTFILNMWGFPYVSLAPVIGERVLELSPIGIGLLIATEALGAFICSLVIILFAKPKFFVPLYSFGALVFCVGVASLGYWSLPIPAFACLFVAGLGMACFNSMQITIPLLATPPEFKVRVIGLVTVCIGSSPFGMLHAGWLAEWLGAQPAQLIIGAEGLCALLWAYWRWPELLQAKAPAPA